MRPTRLLTGLASMAVLVVGLVTLLPDCASACTCAMASAGPSQQEIVKRALSDSAAVFAGEVVSITKGEPGGAWRPATVTVSFRVSEVWKGPERETLEVSTPRDGASCGYPFKNGQEYLVYAYGKEEPFKEDLCGETTPLSEARADLEALGNGETMGSGGAVLSDTSGGFLPLGVIGMLGGAVAVLSLVVLMRLVRAG